MSFRPLKIANAQAFWGDQVDAASRLLSQQPDLDYLTLDYLAEVSLSILAIQKEKDPTAGYARDFLDTIRSLVPFWKEKSKTRLVSNAGGLNPEGCALACKEILKTAGCEHIKIAVVTGDDVLSILKERPTQPLFRNLETNESLEKISNQLVSANAYLGARPIAEAIGQGADIVITGRGADPSLVVGPCMTHFGWSWEDYNRIAGATIAGHLIECGTQATGGFSTDWLTIPAKDIGYPVVEMHPDSSFVITKPPQTGGHVRLETVKEQLLYEIGDPGNYMSPDAIVSFLSLSLDQIDNDRIKIQGGVGKPPSTNYKVSATYRDGYKAYGMLTIFGRDAVQKAKLCGELILERLKKAGHKPERSLVECLGTGASVQGIFKKLPDAEQIETVLRISVADLRRETVERFSKEIASLVTSGPQGVTGYVGGRPKVQQVFGYWPCLIEKEQVKPVVQII